MFERLESGGRHAVIACVGMLVLASFVICLCLGRLEVPIEQTVRIIGSRLLGIPLDITWTDQMETAIVTIRLPRILAAALVGAALSLSGATYQGVFKNPLVSPDLLGVSNGACVGAAAAILLGLQGLGIQLFALVAGLAAVGIAVSIPRFFKNSSNLMLVLAGVIVSGLMGSLLGLAKYVADPDDQLASIVFWTMGSFSTVRIADVLIVLPAIVATMAVLVALRWRVNLLSLGENEARSLGMDIRFIRGILILCATILTSCAICLCGTIGWVGLVVPHLGRLLVGHDNRYLIPASGLLGACFMIVVDTIARNLTGSEIPISIITGVLGAPLFIWFLAKQKARVE